MASATPDLYGYLPSHMASPPLDRYHIILLGDSGTCVNNLPEVVTWKRNVRDSNRRPFESQVQCRLLCRVCESSFLLLQYAVEYLIEYSSNNTVLRCCLIMTFVISAFQMYVLHFGRFFENRKNSGLTPGQNDDPDVKDDPLTRWPNDPVPSLEATPTGVPCSLHTTS